MQQFVLQAPPTYQAERRYIYDVLLGDFLGLDYRIEWADRRDVALARGDGRQLILADRLFSLPADQWLTRDSLPRPPLPRFRAPAEFAARYAPLAVLPVIYGEPCDAPEFFRPDPPVARLGLDVFGSAFFMLTRYEELVKRHRDRLGRFLAAESLARGEGFLERPIVNDYLELLWLLIERLWPECRRKTRSFQIEPTHDIDRPRLLRRWSTCLRTAAGDLIKRRRPNRAAGCLLQGTLAACRLPHRDRFDTFDWLMDVSQQHGCRSTFYLMASGEYPLNDPRIRRLIRRIHARGHALGVHPNLGTDRDGRRLADEVRAVRECLEAEGIPCQALGGRQHCLSWKAPTTWQHYEDAGLADDSTLSHPDGVGFRCGTCYPYPVFNLLTRKRLSLVERPLLAMECSILGDKYMNLPHDEAWDRLAAMRERVRQCGGSFRILWHNSWFNGRPEEFTFYRSLLGA